MYTLVYPSIPLYTHVYHSIPMYTLVCPCIPLYTLVYLCIPEYTHVYPCLPMYTHVTRVTHGIRIGRANDPGFRSLDSSMKDRLIGWKNQKSKLRYFEAKPE